MAIIDLTRFSPEYLEAAKTRWEALSEDHKTLEEVGKFDFGVDHYGDESNEHFEIDFTVNLQDSKRLHTLYFSPFFRGMTTRIRMRRTQDLDSNWTSFLPILRQFTAISCG